MKQKPIKPVEAWAVVSRAGIGVANAHYTKSQMLEAVGDANLPGVRVIRVLITPITKKARRK